MSALQLLLLAQVVSCFVAEGIMTYEAAGTPEQPQAVPQKVEQPLNSWQNILKSAMFRTLVKYTNFSPSLDVKMEADSLLWEKLNTAKYTRKVPKHLEEDETLKTGVLIDLSRENGHLEFRQVEKSLYTLEPKDHRLLAYWRMKMIRPNQYLIQIKVPEEPPIEHFYEYSQPGGLKETRLKEADYSRSKQNKNGPWKIRARKAYSPPTDILSNSNSFHKQPEHYVVRSHLFNGNRHKIPHNVRQEKATRTFLHKPTTQYYTVIGIQSPPPPQKYPTAWTEFSSYPSTYSINRGKEYTEFGQGTDYDGFVPSLGPGTSPPAYSSTPNTVAYASGVGLAEVPLIPSAVAYKHNENYPKFVHKPSPQILPTQQAYVGTYFKPSVPFVQYSELDPFYATNNDSYDTYGMIDPATADLSLLGQLPLYYNSLPAAAISVQVPDVEQGKSLYDVAINSLRNESLKPQNEEQTSDPQPTASNSLDKHSPSTENPESTEYAKEISHQTTVEILKPTIPEEGPSKTRVKNSLKNPQRTPNTGGDGSYEYAPMYIKWGEKIRPADKGKFPNIKTRNERLNALRTTTTTAPTTTAPTTTTVLTSTTANATVSTPKETKNETQINPGRESNVRNNKNKNSISLLSPSERLQELQKKRLTLKTRNQLKERLGLSTENTPTSTELTIVNSTTKSVENGTNYYFSNITRKSPEEIVRDYTTMGLRNGTNVESSENLRNSKAKIESQKIKLSKLNDSENEGSEPISVVVRRISQSVSYKTSEGEPANVKKIVEKT